MERILDFLEVEKSVKNDEYAKLLADAGMKSRGVARENGFQPITIEAISSYLLKVAMEKNGGGSHQEGWETTPFIKTATRTVNKFLEYSTYRTTVKWIETDPDKYDGDPPVRILQKMVEHKDKFDELKFVTVEVEQKVTYGMPDPLLIGIKNGKRFLIDWWDNDIDPSELV